MSLRKSVPFYVILGVISFANVSRNLRFASFHAVDVVQLLVSGVCFGFAVGALIAGRRKAAQDDTTRG
jgi:hypothetical protein